MDRRHAPGGRRDDAVSDSKDTLTVWILGTLGLGFAAGLIVGLFVGLYWQ